ncbi:MAG: Kelch repeat-containing protein, partial [Pyrinomonadaceae bacterium]
MRMQPRRAIARVLNYSLATASRLNRRLPASLVLIVLAIIAATAVATGKSSAGSLSQLFFGAAGTSTNTHAEGPHTTLSNTSLMATALPQSAGLNNARRGHTATRLGDGRVLIAGGENSSGELSESEIFDPTSGTFSVSGNMTASRADHAATKLNDGRVLITGGRDGSGTLGTTEIFDPATGTYSSGPAMGVARAGHSATLLADGRVLIAGGNNSGSAEIFDPSSSTFSSLSANLNSARSKHSAALLLYGRVLLVGGQSGDGLAGFTAEIFDPAGSSFSTVDSELRVARVLPHLRVLFDGKVQIIGGNNDGSMEIYDPLSETIGAYAHVVPETDPCANLVDYVMSSQTRAALFHNGQSDALRDRSGHTITELYGSNQALVAGGVNSGGSVLSSASTLNSSPASITTDKLDYAPGETVNLSGHGWQPGETVRIMIHEDPHTPQERGL